MSESQKSTLNSDDVSSDTSALKSKLYDALDSVNTSIKDSRVYKSKTGVHTEGYTVKKITTSYHTLPKQDTKGTRLNDLSIDTNCSNNIVQTNEHQISKTTIETGVFSTATISEQASYPLIIDEIDQHEKEDENDAQTMLLKRDKISSSSQNISLDISSEFSNPMLPSDTEGERLGTGTIVGVLGTGGMARVYRTWNEKLEIYRAVKILLPTYQQEQWDRFLTEAKITVKLHHPNIVETYDTGEWHGLPFIEMELIEGETLNLIISNHHLVPSPVCCAIAIEISKALAYAHSQQIMIYGKMYNGLIHRDLKPSNIMVTSAGIVKLMDFGVARPIETGFHTIATDSIVGTMQYFSPEQINGYPVDPLSDVYSFGAVMYELLCGVNPFSQSNMVNLVQAKTKNQFERLEEFHLKIDHRLASVAQTCLRTDKKERYENFRLIRNILEEILNSYQLGDPVYIISEFYRNPEYIRNSFERFYDNRQTAPRGIQQEKPQEEIGKEDGVSEIVETITPKEPVLAVSKGDSTLSYESDLWEKKVSKHRHRILIAAAFLVILLVSGNVITGGKFLKRAIGQENYQLIVNTLKGKLAGAEQQ